MYIFYHKVILDKLLTKKEELKGSLENILNETMKRIKELKVGGVHDAVGMPTEAHKRNLDNQIETEIMNFETMLIIFAADNYTLFKMDEVTNLINCMNIVKTPSLLPSMISRQYQRLESIMTLKTPTMSVSTRWANSRQKYLKSWPT